MVVWHDTSLGETLSMFRREHGHLAIVRDVISIGNSDPFYAVVGIITLEDIIEEILGTEIEDETDSVVANGDEGNATNFKAHRDMDLARLKSLRCKITDDALSEDEIQAIVYSVETTVPQYSELLHHKYPDITLHQIIQHAGVLIMTRKTPVGEKTHPDDVLIRRGKMTNSCILVLQGRVKIIRNELTPLITSLTANEPFADIIIDGEPSLLQPSEEVEEEGIITTTYNQEVIRGPWKIIGENVLLSLEGTFIPDFSVVIDSELIRFVRISTFTSDRFSQLVDGLSTIERKRRKLLSGGTKVSQIQNHPLQGEESIHHHHNHHDMLNEHKGSLSPTQSGRKTVNSNHSNSLSNSNSQRNKPSFQSLKNSVKSTIQDWLPGTSSGGGGVPAASYRSTTNLIWDTNPPSEDPLSPSSCPLLSEEPMHRMDTAILLDDASLKSASTSASSSKKKKKSLMDQNITTQYQSIDMSMNDPVKEDEEEEEKEGLVTEQVEDITLEDMENGLRSSSTDSPQKIRRYHQGQEYVEIKL